MLLGLLTLGRQFHQVCSSEELGHAIGWLRADADPMLGALLVELHPVGIVLGEHRVVVTDPLDETPVTGPCLVGDNDTVEGTLFCATACQSNT